MSRSSGDEYHLRLYITGATPHSSLAVRNITAICETYLPGRCKLEIIDIYQQPELAQSKEIIAAPTLVKLTPLPETRLIGDLSDQAKVLHLLGIVAPEQEG